MLDFQTVLRAAGVTPVQLSPPPNHSFMCGGVRKFWVWAVGRGAQLSLCYGASTAGELCLLGREDGGPRHHTTGQAQADNERRNGNEIEYLNGRKTSFSQQSTKQVPAGGPRASCSSSLITGHFVIRSGAASSRHCTSRSAFLTF